MFSSCSQGSPVIDSYLNSTEDCHFLLRALEKQAFENVVFAFRAQGPLTQYTELLLGHLKAALSITDEEFNIKIRMAANNPHICRIAQQLNPSYDNDARWVSLGYDLTGIGLARIRKLDAANTDPKLLSNHIRELHKHNHSLPHANDALSLLMQLPKRPYVPERVRKFLHDSEMKLDGRISIEKEEKVDFFPTQQMPAKKSVGRPRKRKRVEDEKKTKEKPLKKDKKEETNRMQKEHPIEEEQKEELLKNEETLKKCAQFSQLNVKVTLFNKQKAGNSPKMVGSHLREFALTQPNSSSVVEKSGGHSNQPMLKSFPVSADYPSSFSSHLQKSQILSVEPPSEGNIALSKLKHGHVSADFDCEGTKSKEEAHNERRENETFVCARVRPFNGTIQPRTQATDRRPKRTSIPINRSNDLQMPQKYYSNFCLNSKYYGQTPIRMTKNQCNLGTSLHSDIPIPKRSENPFEEWRKPNDVANQSQSSTESATSVLSTHSLPLQVASARFVACSSHQNPTTSNAVVEADHAYEKASPSFPIEKDGTTIANVSSVLPVITDKFDAPTNGHTENGQIVTNGTCSNGTLLRNRLTTLSTLDLTRTSEFLANQPISMDEEVVETSGLDFLASTASLLAPIGPSAVKCNDKFAATSQG